MAMKEQLNRIVGRPFEMSFKSEETVAPVEYPFTPTSEDYGPFKLITRLWIETLAARYDRAKSNGFLEQEPVQLQATQSPGTLRKTPLLSPIPKVENASADAARRELAEIAPYVQCVQ